MNHHIGRPTLEARGEPGALRLGDVAHRVERSRAAIVDLVPELLGAQLGLAHVEPRLLQRRPDRLTRQADEIDAASPPLKSGRGTGTGSICPGMVMTAVMG
jgi:hypothetical protein